VWLRASVMPSVCRTSQSPGWRATGATPAAEGRADSTLVSRSPREPEALDAVEQGSPQPAAVVGFGATKKLAADGSRLGSGMSRAD
jgi:transcription elongation factor